MSPSDAEVTELPSSPGARLRREREARGLSEQQAAETLNLDPSVVANLEANDFAALGAPVFVKGHLRRYANLLELDADEIVGAYERSKQHIDEPTLVPKARLEMVPVRGRSRWPLVVGGTAAFLIAAGLLAYLTEHGLPWSSQPAADESVADAPAIAPGDTLPPAAAVGAAPVSGSEGTLTPTPPPATPPAGVAGAPGSAAAGTAPNVAPSSAPGTTTTASAPSTAAAPAPGQVRLQLRFSGDSWVEIFDGSGKAVVYDLGKTGTERTVTATAPLSVTIGNAPAVAIMINGRAIPPPPAPGAVARFSVGADGNLR
jgi:cytoskeleton protein RodZ